MLGEATDAETDNVVDVAQVGRDARQGGNAVVEGVEVEIGEELAGEVADGQAMRAFQGRQQGIAREGMEGRAAAGAVGEDAVEQPQGAAEIRRRLGSRISNWR